MNRDLEHKLNYIFIDPSLCEQARRHRSLGSRNNERLEFLGDGVLNFVVAEEVYRRFPDSPEGDLSRIRARLVREETLAEVAMSLDLGDDLLLGPGELKSGGFRRHSILADTLEAILGAVYLDGGFEKAQSLILRLMQPHWKKCEFPESLKDPKSRLQEYLQRRGLALPEYTLIESKGPDHQRVFKVECRLEDGSKYRAEGRSRRKAEQIAAKMAMDDKESESQSA